MVGSVLSMDYMFIQGNKKLKHRTPHERRQVRAYAQRSHQASKRQAAEDKAPDHASVSNTSDAMILKFRLQTAPRKRRSDARGLVQSDEKPPRDSATRSRVKSRYKAPRTASPTHSGVDPHNWLPFRLDHDDKSLLHQFQSYMRWPWCPVSGRSEWSAFTVSDELVFRVTMYSWATHIRNRQPTGYIESAKSQNMSLKNKAKAISMINERLSDSNAACSDEVLAGVAALTNIEVAFGSREEATIHINGLYTLVERRGGLQTLSSPRQELVQRLIAWNDLLYAELYEKDLVFPQLDLWDRAWRSLVAIQDPKTSHAWLANFLWPSTAIGAEMPAILYDVHLLSELEAKQPLTSLPDQMAMARGDSFHRLEYKLQCLLNAEVRPNELLTVIALATLVYVHHFLRGNPLTYRHFYTLLPSLVIGLSRSSCMNELRFSAPVIHLWLLAIGAVTSQRLDHLHLICLKLLAGLCLYRGFNRATFLDDLRSFLWCGAIDEDRYSTLWQKVEKLLLGGDLRPSSIS